jgi:hypothetical protein
MPAIKLTDLKKRSARLAGAYNQPDKFIQLLHHILDEYSERAHRAGQSGTPPPLIPTYNVPNPVLRQLQRRVIARLKDDPSNGLKLVDDLWEEPYFEFRLMAAQLLGQLPAHQPEEIVERVRLWSQKETDRRLLNSLLQDALAEVQRQHTSLLLDLINSWLGSETTFDQQLGLQAMNLLLANPDFEDIPYLLKLLTPYVRSSPSQIHPEIVNVIKTLAKRTPKETAFFLRQNLEAPENPDTAFLIRRCASFFPPELQDRLRASTRGSNPPDE